MSDRWAVRLSREAAGALGPLRRLPGLEACADGDTLWLRGEGDETLLRRLVVLPESRLYAVLADGQLVPHGKLVPDGRLPGGPWVPLPRWLGVETGVPSLPGRLAERVALRVVTSTAEREANVLLTSLESWAAYAVEAPQVRLSRWTFAVASSSPLSRFGGEGPGVRGSACGANPLIPGPSPPKRGRGEGEVIIRGTPLPPIAGRLYCETDGLAVQAGYAWEPAVDAAVVATVLGLAKGDLALLNADGTWDHVLAGDLVAASRSAVRRTVEEAARG